METIESERGSSPRRSKAWAIPAIIAALVAGILVGVWWQRRGFDSGDLVGIVSVLGSVGVAVYTVRSSHESDRDRLAHDRVMQSQEIRESRSRLHREEAVRRLIEVRRTIAPATPITIDFSRFTHAATNEDELVAENKDKIFAALRAAAQGAWEVDWFTLIGWTDEIQQRAIGVHTVLGDLIEAWGIILDSYYRTGVTDPSALHDQVDATWKRVEASLDDLRSTLRAELAREPVA